MAKTSFYSGSGPDSNDVSALENLKNQAQTSATAAAASASSAAASVASLNEDVATQSTKGLMSAADKTKLDGVESSADVTDTANVTAAGALMDSEVTSLSGIKTLTVPDSTTVSTFGASLVDDADAAAARTTLGLGTAATTASTAYATAAQGTTADAALPKAGGTMTGAITFASGQTFDGRDVSADGTKLDTIETNADVTDATNVQAAGALMDSELTSEASVKAINQGVATTDSPTFAGLTTTADVSFGDNDKAIFGAGSDLSIYHDTTGPHSYIVENGSGSLIMQTNGNGILVEKTDGDNLAYFDAANNRAVLYNGGDIKLATTSTGVDITGTLTSDGLTVDGLAKIQGTATGLVFNETDTTDLNGYIINNNGDLNFMTVNDAFTSFDTRLQIDHATGDISFYEDTGTTAKFFWDASAEQLDLGTFGSTVTGTLNVKSDANHRAISIEENVGSETWQLGVNVDGDLNFHNSGSATPSVTFDDTGNVGIGTTSPPTSKLEVNVDGTSAITVRSSDGGQANLIFGDQADADRGRIVYSNADESMRFAVNNLVEAMRITSDGSVGIGTSSPSDMNAAAYRLVVGDGSGDEGLTIYSGTANNGAIHFADGISGTQEYRGWIQYQHSTEAMRFGTSSVEAMRIDSSGNVGIGVTPESWSNGGANPDFSSLQLGTATALSGTDATSFMSLTSNAYRASTGWKYINSDYAARYDHNDAEHVWYTAASGGADTAISWSESMRIDSSGNVGIGTTSPSELLEVSANKDAAIKITSTDTALLTGETIGSIKFESKDASGTPPHTSAQIDVIAEDVFGRGAMAFSTGRTGDFQEGFRLDSSGNLLIAGTGTPTSSVGNLVLYNGTAPTGNATDGVILYAEDVSSSSELKVRDEAGNVTTLSPHNFDLIPEGPSEDMAWSYYSERDGKRINVDMLKAVRLLEQLTGEKLVHIV